ncbi:hypothetical protein ENBRE01_1638 [Enteropsectra breve]|nr:hypothetical protein ENBRE01_1638 [Enteropsectra breve]
MRNLFIGIWLHAHAHPLLTYAEYARIMADEENTADTIFSQKDCGICYESMATPSPSSDNCSSCKHPPVSAASNEECPVFCSKIFTCPNSKCQVFYHESCALLSIQKQDRNLDPRSCEEVTCAYCKVPYSINCLEYVQRAYLEYANGNNDIFISDLPLITRELGFSVPDVFGNSHFNSNKIHMLSQKLSVCESAQIQMIAKHLGTILLDFTEEMVLGLIGDYLLGGDLFLLDTMQIAVEKCASKIQTPESQFGFIRRIIDHIPSEKLRDFSPLYKGMSKVFITNNSPELLTRLLSKICLSKYSIILEPVSQGKLPELPPELSAKFVNKFSNKIQNPEWIQDECKHKVLSILFEFLTKSKLLYGQHFLEIYNRLLVEFVYSTPAVACSGKIVPRNYLVIDFAMHELSTRKKMSSTGEVSFNVRNCPWFVYDYAMAVIIKSIGGDLDFRQYCHILECFITKKQIYKTKNISFLFIAEIIRQQERFRRLPAFVKYFLENYPDDTAVYNIFTSAVPLLDSAQAEKILNHLYEKPKYALRAIQSCGAHSRIFSYKTLRDFGDVITQETLQGVVQTSDRILFHSIGIAPWLDIAKINQMFIGQCNMSSYKNIGVLFFSIEGMKILENLKAENVKKILGCKYLEYNLREFSDYFVEMAKTCAALGYFPEEFMHCILIGHNTPDDILYFLSVFRKMIPLEKRVPVTYFKVLVSLLSHEDAYVFVNAFLLLGLEHGEYTALFKYILEEIILGRSANGSYKEPKEAIYIQFEVQVRMKEHREKLGSFMMNINEHRNADMLHRKFTQVLEMLSSLTPYQGSADYSETLSLKDAFAKMYVYNDRNYAVPHAFINRLKGLNLNKDVA